MSSPVAAAAPLGPERVALRRRMALGLSAFALVLFAADLVLRWQKTPTPSRQYEQHYFRKDSSFGRSPPLEGDYPSRASAADGELVYDVVYSIDRHGFRQTRGGGEGAEGYLFFGGSFTFGEGVENSEAYPQRFSEALDYRYTVVNASFHAFGAHQMLRRLELGLVDDALTGPVRHVVYLAISTHPDRAVGWPSWARLSPRYELDENGRVAYRGTNDTWFVRGSTALQLMGGLPALVDKSWHVATAQARADRLWVAIVEQSAQIADREYGADFLCLLWDRGDLPRIERLEAMLKERGIETLRISTFIGSLEESEIKIRPGIEPHPSARAHEAIGYGLARYLEPGHFASDPPQAD